MNHIDTHISWGYKPLLDIFAKANSLVLKYEPYHTSTDQLGEFTGSREYIRIIFDEGSDTAQALSFMSLRHCGIENMLVDYLIKCNIDPILIPVGKYVMRKSNDEMERDWQEHRKKIGLTR